MNRRHKAWAIVAILVVAAAAWAGEASPPQAATGLASLMAERLEWAPRIAWTKFQNNQPVTDAAREAQVLQEVAAAAAREGVDGKTAVKFFKAQMAASRIVQRTLIQKWHRGGELPAFPPADLRVARRELDRIGLAMLAALRDGPPANRKEARKVLVSHGIPLAAVRAAVKPLPR